MSSETPHVAREEPEHAAMILEWLRRNDKDRGEQLKECLFKEGSITGHEEGAGETHEL